MTAFDIAASEIRAKRRLGDCAARSGSSIGARADAGKPRIAQEALDRVRAVLVGQERPRMRDMMRALAGMCRARKLVTPSRATVYKLMAVVPGPTYRFEELPAAVRATLYNLGPGCGVPGHQVAFHCFNYGSTEAMCFAAGMPWLALYQAMRLPGWRTKSRGLIEAVALTRGIIDGRA